jgi:hypothetical protein
MGLTAGCDTGTGLIKLTCDLSVTLSGLTSAAAHGERFDIVDTDTTLSQLRCGGGPAFSLVRSGIDPGDPITAQNLSLLSFHGDCTVTVVLRESSGTTTPVFGGATKVLSGGFTVGDATTYDAAASDFSAEWDGSVAGSQVLVKYRGTTFTDTQVAQLTADWEVTVRGPGGEDCGTRTQQPTGDGIDVAASVDCVRQFGDRTGWSVDISYRDEGAATRHDVPGSHLLEGAPPGYQPCAPGTFIAAWGAAQSDGVTVTYTGDQAQLAGCSGFTYTLQDETGGSCTVQSDVDPKLPDVIQPACATPIADGWSVAISWHNDNTNGTGNAPDIDLGTAPPP